MKRLYVLITVLVLLILIMIGIEIIERKQKKEMQIKTEEKRLRKEIENKQEKIDFLIWQICNTNAKETKRRLKELKKEEGIIWKKGFAFKHDKILLFDPEQVYLGFYLSRKQIKESKNEILKYSEINFDLNVMITYDSYKEDPYNTIKETEKVFCVKIDGYTLYLKDPFDEKGEWEPLKIRFIEELEPDPDREHAQYPCMRVYLETKWFRGEYEVDCE